jgi:polysaccharide biosynthesis/export protein
MKNFWLSLCIASAAFALCQGQSTAPNGAATEISSKSTPNATPSGSSGAPVQFEERDSRYRMQPGDSFDLSFDLSPEFNQQAVQVQPDGFVTLRGVGDVKVQGQTVPELTQTLRTAYSRILNNPIISIVLKDFQKPYFIADGQLGRPGKYDLRADTTLTEAIAIAGGFTDESKHSQVLLFRRVNEQWMSAKIFNVKQMEKSGKLDEDPFLHPGDMIFVPKNRLSKIKPFIPNTGVNAFAKSY